MSTKNLVSAASIVVFLLLCYFIYDAVKHYDPSKQKVSLITLVIIAVAMLFIVIKNVTKKSV